MNYATDDFDAIRRRLDELRQARIAGDTAANASVAVESAGYCAACGSMQTEPGTWPQCTGLCGQLTSIVV